MTNENLDLNIVSKEQIKDWLWYGILQNKLDTKITDDILMAIGVSEEDEEKYDFALEVMAKTAEAYFEIGFNASNAI